jgi:hypothetical protein
MRMRAISGLCLGLVAGLVLSACYYKGQTRRTKADPSFLSEAEAEETIQKRLAPHGIKLVSNMRLQREGVAFEADGYDRDLRVGYEYMSHEGGDFEDQDANPDGLSRDELETLQARQDTYREYFLIVPEGRREAVEQAVDDFIKRLYEHEVLKEQKKVKTGDSLFPEGQKATGEALPWESTGDLKKKREEMERREADRDKEEADDEKAWQGGGGEDDPGGKKSTADKKPAEKKSPEKKAPDKKPAEKTKEPPKPGSKPEGTQDPWSDEEEDF